MNSRTSNSNGQRHVVVAVASSRSAFATHLRLEAAATMCLREQQNPALSLESDAVRLMHFHECHDDLTANGCRDREVRPRKTV